MNRKLSFTLIQKFFRAICVAVLLAAGQSGCTTQTVASKDSPAERRVGGRAVDQIVGKWQKRQTGAPAAEYARYADDTGTFETLEIRSDGTVKRRIAATARVYDCPVEDLSTSEGAVIVESETHLNLTFDTGETRHTETCSRDKNFTSLTKPTTTDYQWQVSQADDSAPELCLTNTETVCYRRVE